MDKMVFCTLFDINYLDKACVMYDSLVSTEDEFTLYVLAMDERVYDILNNMNLENVVLIPLLDIMDDKLRNLRKERSKGEFCWTCTSVLIQYVIIHFKEKICTYIDSDLCFYSSPRILFDEFDQSGASIGIIEHRYNNNLIGKRSKMTSGTYCVEFNTFRNDNYGMEALEWWKQACLNECSADTSNNNLGDQMYLEDWPSRFKGVFVYKNPGAGMAPWNISQYKMNDNKELIFDSRVINPIFYHFHGITYYKDYVTIGVYYRATRNDDKLVHYLYNDYLEKIEKKRIILKNNYKIEYNYKDISRKVTTYSRNNSFWGFLKRISFYRAYIKTRIILSKHKDMIYFSNIEV